MLLAKMENKKPQSNPSREGGNSRASLLIAKKRKQPPTSLTKSAFIETGIHATLPNVHG